MTWIPHFNWLTLFSLFRVQESPLLVMYVLLQRNNCR